MGSVSKQWWPRTCLEEALGIKKDSGLWHFMPIEGTDFFFFLGLCIDYIAFSELREITGPLILSVPKSHNRHTY